MNVQLPLHNTDDCLGRFNRLYASLQPSIRACIAISVCLHDDDDDDDDDDDNDDDNDVVVDDDDDDDDDHDDNDNDD